jgi:hypothetical protein
MVVVLTDSSNSSTGVVVPVVGDSSSRSSSSIDADSSNKSTTSTTPEKDPARNLTHAFEALCVDRDNDDVHDEAGAAIKQGPPGVTPAVISPTSVAEQLRHDLPTAASSSSSSSPPASGATAGGLHNNLQTNPHHHQHRGASPVPKATANKATVGLALHPDLQRELTQPQVNRVSFYSIVHDINKEALAMAANDALSQVPDPAEEEHSPLVLAAGVVPAAGPAAAASVGSSKKEAVDLSVALIDEGAENNHMTIAVFASVVFLTTDSLTNATLLILQRSGCCRPSRRGRTPPDPAPPPSSRRWARRSTRTRSRRWPGGRGRSCGSRAGRGGRPSPGRTRGSNPRHTTSDGGM